MQGRLSPSDGFSKEENMVLFAQSPQGEKSHLSDQPPQQNNGGEPLLYCL